VAMIAARAAGSGIPKVTPKRRGAVAAIAET
jgi:hypothetical protein